MQNELKKCLKKDTGRIGWGLIFYSIIMMVFTMIMASLALMGIAVERGSADFTELELAQLSENATGMIFGVVIGVLFLTLFMRKKVSLKEMFEPKKKMTAGSFFRLLAVFMAAQFVFSYAAQLLEAGLNSIGYSAMDSIEAATDQSQTVSMFLYASFIAPVVEELVYRGFVMEPLRKYGKVFAIVVSAVLFGVMHANIPQAIFAIVVGLVLGYTAMEYSVFWSIAIHMANNFVFGEVLTWIGGLLGETAGTILSGAVILAFFIVGIVILWKNRQRIREYIAENQAEKGSYRYAFTTVSIILFLAFHLIMGFSMLTPLT